MMLNISEIVKDWDVVNGWAISTGVSWCRKGFRVKVGIECFVGDWASVGDRARFYFILNNLIPKLIY